MKLVNFHNIVPDKVMPKTIGIIGGRGAMGQMLAREFSADGFRVITTGGEHGMQPHQRELRALNQKLVRRADVIVIAVPVNVLMGGLDKILGRDYLRGLRGKLFVDICSTKV